MGKDTVQRMYLSQKGENIYVKAKEDRGLSVVDLEFLREIKWRSESSRLLIAD